MAYKDRFGITQIIPGKIDNLSINWDFDTNQESIRQRYPVFLYTPDMGDTNTHYHIRLTPKKAEKLRDWLDAYLKEQKKCR